MRIILLIILSFTLWGCITKGPNLDDAFELQKSEDARLPKKIDYFALLAGEQVYGMYDRGLGGGFYLSPNEIIEGEFTGATNCCSNTPLYPENNSASFAVAYKRFFGNSFYVKGGFRYRQLDVNKEKAMGFYFSGKRTEFNLSIGNQWQWKYLHFGIGWLNLTAPLGYTFKEDGVFDPSYQEQLDYEKHRFATTGVVWYPSLYFGASF